MLTGDVLEVVVEAEMRDEVGAGGQRRKQQGGEEGEGGVHGCMVIHFFGAGGRALIHARLKA